VRASKYRHLFGTVGQSDENYRGIRIGSGISPESNVIKASSSYFAFPWFVTGALCVVPLGQKSAIAEDGGCLITQEPIVLEFNFSPFSDSHLITAAQDGVARVFQIPAAAARGVTQAEALVSISASTKRLLIADYHPLAENVVVTVSGDHELKLWDLNSAEAAKVTLAGQHKGIITSLAWNADGSLCATSCKDKQLRVLDPRSGKVVAEVKDLEGAKSGRVAWQRARDRLITVGFNKTTERQMNVYDPRVLGKPLSSTVIDASSATLMPFLDEDLGIVYLASKGEGNIMLYEGVDEAGQLHPLTVFKSNVPQSGLAMLPKSVCNRAKCEVLRFIKLSPQYAVPVRFEVPRQSGGYQEDLYPPTWDGKPSTTADAYFAGKAAPPNLMAWQPVAV